MQKKIKELDFSNQLISVGTLCESLRGNIPKFKILNCFVSI